MTRPRGVFLAGLLLSVAGAGSAELAGGAVADGPEYASPRSREVIERMVEAHGGIERWRSAAAISYDNYFFNPFWEQSGWNRPFWQSHEVIEQKTRRVHQYWPLLDARIGYDGTDVWSENYRLGNPAKFQVHFFYYFVNLPWITQDPNVTLGEPGIGRLPGLEKDFVTVELGFTDKPSVGKNERDGFRLYIDPDTHLLRGYEYWVAWGPMLDMMNVPAGEVFGPMVRVHTNFANVGGLVVPSEFGTYMPGGDRPVGHHMINNYRLERTFDESATTLPPGGIVDETRDVRTVG